MVCKGVVYSDMTDFYEVLFAPFECYDYDRLGVWRSARKMSPQAFMNVVKNYECEALRMESVECKFCGDDSTFLGLSFEPPKNQLLWRPPFLSRWQCDDSSCRYITLVKFPSDRVKN